ncbi:hypothetical protein ACE7GA_06900 [Roseomonas sp. CCTCC AB2023176]|uniref:hypothetical protein n=1 Tax=Roseomonas sp. CCTCC AB2023176 TaxID=3342640 RepID=UPI0035E16981
MSDALLRHAFECPLPNVPVRHRFAGADGGPPRGLAPRAPPPPERPERAGWWLCAAPPLAGLLMFAAVALVQPGEEAPPTWTVMPADIALMA